MSKIAFEDDGWLHYLYWQMQDRKTLNKIHRLLKSIERDGVLGGEGKPEKLKDSDNYSRRIDEKNRLIYDISSNGFITVKSCKGHYGDK